LIVQSSEASTLSVAQGCFQPAFFFSQHHALQPAHRFCRRFLPAGFLFVLPPVLPSVAGGRVRLSLSGQAGLPQYRLCLSQAV